MPYRITPMHILLWSPRFRFSHNAPVICLVCFMAGVVSQSYAQAPIAPSPSYTLNSWAAHDGHPVGSIKRMDQGPDGYLWMYSTDGLVRFDGVRFETFTLSPEEEASTNRLRAFEVDSQGRVWMINTRAEVLLFANNTFRSLAEEQKVMGDLIGPPHEGPAGAIWFGTTQGMFRYEAGTFQPFLPEGIHEAIGTIYEEPTGTIWASAVSGTLYSIQPDSTIERHALPLDITAPYFFSRDHNGQAWIGTRRGAARRVQGHFVPLTPHQPVRIQTIIHEPDGTTWIKSYRQTFVFEQDELREVTHRRSLNPRLYDVHLTAQAGTVYQNGAPIYSFDTDLTFSTAFVDKEGSIWLATRERLYQLQPAVFSHWTLLGSPPMNLLEDRNGSIWIATEGGVQPARPASLWQLEGTTLSKWGNIVDRSPEQPTPLFALVEDSSGALWAGGRTLCTVRGQTCVDVPVETENHVSEGTIHTLYADADGTVWLGASNGLFHQTSTGWKRYEATEDLHVVALAQTSDGSLWVTGRTGTLPKPMDQLYRLQNDGLVPVNFPGNQCSQVRTVYEDPAGTLWLGTRTEGLCRVTDWLQPSQSTVTRITTAHGLPDNDIYTVLEDAQGRLWLSTYNSIFWMAKDQLDALAEQRINQVTPVSYDERDGLSRIAYASGPGLGLKDRMGRLWFARSESIVMVDPTTIPVEPPAPPVVIQTAQVGRETFVPDETIRLNPDQRSFEVTYTALSFIKSEDLQFRYRLEGMEEAWYEAGTERHARFTNLDPGTYTFHVVARDSRGGINTEGARVRVIRMPHFYETRLFYGTVAFLGIALVVGLFRYRVRSITKRNRMLEAKVAERTEALEHTLETVADQAEALQQLDRAKSHFFANISHEFRTPLTLIIGPLRRMLEGHYGPLAKPLQDSVPLMLRNSRRLLRLVNQILDLAALELGTLKLRVAQHDVDAFLAQMVDAFQPIAEQEEVNLIFERGDEPCLLYVDAQHFEVIVLNLLANAFKFTEAGGRVVVVLRPHASQAELTVSDTGIGIPEADLPHIFDRFYQVEGSPGTGIGLALVKELVDLHSGTIHVESAVDVGTTFTLWLPTGRAHFSDEQIVASDGLPQPSDLLQELVPLASSQTEQEDDTEANIPTVLIVDDHADIRHFMRSVLADTYHVVEAQDGETGLHKAQTLLPDLIISDVMMPKRDGFSLNRQLKNDPMTASIPVILLTAKASPAATLEGLETGADDYLVKPFDADHLRARIANLIRLRQRLRRLLQEEQADTASSASPRPSEADSFEHRVRSVIQTRLLDEDFSVHTLAAILHTSYPTLNRKLRKEANMSPNQLIKTVRLEMAAQLLENQAGTISEIAYGVGFNNLAYFSRSFKAHYGVNPSAFHQQGPST